MKFSSTLVLSAVAATALAESITTTITATKNGHVYTKTVTQDATFVWTGEGSSNTWSPSRAATSSASTTATTTAETSSSATSSSIAELSSYTGAADAITAGTGLMGAALAAVMLL